MIKLSRGNRKMSNVLIFNLPAQKTCPGSTPECRAKCYAMKAERLYPQARACRAEQLIETTSPDFALDMVHAIIAETSKYKKFSGYFRIHESGDFYCQAYLDDWKYIVSQFPEIHFLAFTKSFHLDYSNIPSNLQIVSSVFSDTTGQPIPNTPIAYAGMAGKQADWIQCQGSCTDCKACWHLSETGNNVHFNMH